MFKYISDKYIIKKPFLHISNQTECLLDTFCNSAKNNEINLAFPSFTCSHKAKISHPNFLAAAKV